MEMTEKEVCRNYLLAIDKAKQIRVLAELNDTTREKITKILTDNGYLITKKKEITKPKPVRKKVKGTRMLYDRLDELDTQIRYLEKQKAEYERQYKLISDYLQKGGSYAGISSYFR